jgi:hypothetical protein
MTVLSRSLSLPTDIVQEFNKEIPLLFQKKAHCLHTAKLEIHI